MISRAGTVGDHPQFIAMVRELIIERTSGNRGAAAHEQHWALEPINAQAVPLRPSGEPAGRAAG